MHIFNKMLENKVSLVGDNCAADEAIVNLVKKLLVGCCSHRSNLGVGNLLRIYEDAVENFCGIMLKLKNEIFAAKLRKQTQLRSFLRNRTRWSSTFQILGWYTVLEPFLKKRQIKEVTSLLLSLEEHSKILKVLHILTKFNSVTKLLQREDDTILRRGCTLTRYSRVSHPRNGVNKPMRKLPQYSIQMGTLEDSGSERRRSYNFEGCVCLYACDGLTEADRRRHRA